MSGSGNSGGTGANRRSFGEDQYATPSAASPDAWDIRKKKAADLERLRLESRLKARLKTDEELGLENSTGARIHNTPMIGLSKPVSPPARSRGLSLTSEPTKSPRVHRSLTVGAYDNDIRVIEVVERGRESESRVQEQRGRPALAKPRAPGLLSRLFSPDSRRPEPRVCGILSPYEPATDCSSLTT
ncbi:unnamed protein product [Strongylus vulgaris]|uniref:Uncharacterized protein n=1 Tax=Strongylus vulgaris TaxID=40348 RepID=A0A3P7J376_STRVU|nr:unnamed protein product [Strongylus vulgaris]